MLGFTKPRTYFCPRTRIAELEAENERQITRAIEFGNELVQLRAERDRLREALGSIAKNTCCGKCQEAALVARAALEGE
jgi:hypothetical protein